MDKEPLGQLAGKPMEQGKLSKTSQVLHDELEQLASTVSLLAGKLYPVLLPSELTDDPSSSNKTTQDYVKSELMQTIENASYKVLLLRTRLNDLIDRLEV